MPPTPDLLYGLACGLIKGTADPDDALEKIGTADALSLREHRTQVALGSMIFALYFAKQFPEYADELREQLVRLLHTAKGGFSVELTEAAFQESAHKFAEIRKRYVTSS